jgi:hypothetical protein
LKDHLSLKQQYVFLPTRKAVDLQNSDLRVSQASRSSGSARAGRANFEPRTNYYCFHCHNNCFRTSDPTLRPRSDLENLQMKY